MMFRSHELALFVASYTLTGRCNPEQELHQRPIQHTASIGLEMAAAKSDSDHALARELQQEGQRERAAVLGTQEEWKDYADALETLVDLAMEKQLIASRADLRGLFREYEERGTFSTDPEGRSWLDLPDGDTIRRVGVSASNVDAPESDPQLAFLIMLARVDRILHNPSKNRELIPQFQQDWELLARTQARLEWAEGPPVGVASAPGPVGTNKPSWQPDVVEGLIRKASLPQVLH
jgi:hypothetical protein